MGANVSTIGKLAPTQAEALLREGRLQAALDALMAQVRAEASNASARVFLFQLLAASGQWERAARQLETAAQLDASQLPMAAAYKLALDGERVRAAVFAGQYLPTVIGEPEPWIALLLQAQQLDASGRAEAAATMRAEALVQAPATAGSIDGVPFEWIADADSRFGPCLEMIVHGGYAWVPFARVSALEFSAPASLCDLLWAQVKVTWTHGGQSMGVVPVRYPGSDGDEDDALRLSRRTDWRQLAEGHFAGQGQRLLATDADEYALLDVRRIDFGTV
ncbi:type VI secretion system accessory protein TagJ [Pseudoxanthomonas sp.]|uniref:type VI secretion system accessory protein TagJ n=1 Tax=Pseudoxanthomonas sp. TaxID=1871049 RepID=UPI00260FB760|nr:type VI secretion system accessory protein TagJ [Pseudoxanthomonas sp.]WDS37816.1 MAG: type VI secretion system accessory protein TagJ [Pseudoxanthomonas sp.]